MTLEEFEKLNQMYEENAKAEEDMLGEELEVLAEGYLTIKSVLFNIAGANEVTVKIDFPEFQKEVTACAEDLLEKEEDIFLYPVNEIAVEDGKLVLYAQSSSTLKELQQNHEAAVKELAEYRKSKEENK